MAEMLLTFHCAATDRAAVAESLRAVTAAPLHLRDERILHNDFSGARVAEQVQGALAGGAIDLVVDDGLIMALVDAAAGARRTAPLRWQTVALQRRGRML